MPDGSFAAAGAAVAWVAVRPEPWCDTAPEPAGALGLVRPAPLLGVACLVFAVGPGARGWSERLLRSGWYAALRPRPADLGEGSRGHGVWPLRPAPGRDGPDPAEEVAAVFSDAVLATVALLDGATLAALGLVRALRGRLRVVVTVGAAQADWDGGAVAALQRLGATVIRGNDGMDAGHLHHFPMRAALRSPSGRLVCVDLADCLMCWPAGRAGILHLVPSNAGQARPVLDGLVGAMRPLTATLIAHFLEHGPDSTLAAIDALARLCGEVLFETNELAPMLFTTGDRLDGVTGTADLLLIHDG